MRISDWSSDVCSSDLNIQGCLAVIGSPPGAAESAYMGGGPPCKDPSAQFCNAVVTAAVKRGRHAPTGASARQEPYATLGISKPQTKGLSLHGISRRGQSHFHRRGTG